MTEDRHDLAPTTVDALARLPRDLALMKMENESITAMAMARPRDPKQVKDRVLAQIAAYPSFARTAIYQKPVGWDPQAKQQKMVRGLSIRMAEALAEAYGYNSVSSEVTPIENEDGTRDAAKVTATFLDYQNGRIWRETTTVSMWYKTKPKRKGDPPVMAKIPEDRFYGVTCRAAASKCIREVILRSVPPGLRSDVMDAAEKAIGDLLTDEGMDKIVAHFAAAGVDQDMLERRLDRSRAAGWTKQDRIMLMGLWEAIQSNETTIQDAFGDLMGDKPEGYGARRSDLSGGPDDTPPDDADDAAHPSAVLLNRMADLSDAHNVGECQTCASAATQDHAQGNLTDDDLAEYHRACNGKIAEIRASRGGKGKVQPNPAPATDMGKLTPEQRVDIIMVKVPASGTPAQLDGLVMDLEATPGLTVAVRQAAQEVILLRREEIAEPTHQLGD